MPPPTAPLVGGRYQVGELLGRGGMGVVHRARDTRVDREVALKMFRSAGGPDAEQRLRQEAALLSRLEHPNLVTAYDAGLDSGPDGGAWLALELLDGPDLASLLYRDGPLDSEVARRVIRDIADALSYIHARGIVHRDLKPANVMLTAEPGRSNLWLAKVTDFGIARLVDEAGITATGVMVGTAAYFSPEQTRGDSAGTASDVYSLGLVAIEALTGTRAFPGTSAETAMARLFRQPSIPDWLDGTWRSLLETMTAADSMRRPSAASIARALHEALPRLSTRPRTVPVPLPNADVDTATTTRVADVAIGPDETGATGVITAPKRTEQLARWFQRRSATKPIHIPHH